MQRVTARAPTRIDFGGGWTDVPPYPEECGGCVCNIAIDRRAEVTVCADQGIAIAGDFAPIRVASLAELPRDGDAALASAALRHAHLSGVSLVQRSGFPRGAGLGGSSALGVALAAAIAAWRGDRPSRDELAERSRAVEVEELRVPGGSQDHYASAHGGALLLKFTRAVDVRRLHIDASFVRAFEFQCTLVYTGESRVSGRTITAVIDAYRAGVPAVRAALSRMAALAQDMASAVERGSVDELGALMAEHWTHQRMLHDGISTPTIERVLAAAHAAGAIGGKALGASGGGCVAVIAPAERAEAVRRAVAAVAELVPFSVDLVGATVESAPEAR